MNVQTGRSSDFGKKKISVMVEEADFPLILIECDVPVGVAATIAAKDKYRVMWNTAEMYVLDAWFRLEGEGAPGRAEKEQIKADAQARRAERDALLAPYKAAQSVGP
jgi:hypothetical protein